MINYISANLMMVLCPGKAAAVFKSAKKQFFEKYAVVFSTSRNC